MKQILVYDDHKDFSKKWVSKLESKKHITDLFSVRPLSTGEFNAIIEELINRQLGKDREKTDPSIDDTSILFIDYKLFNKDSGFVITGEEAAYLIRSYSKCKIIIGVNQYSHNGFDLNLEDYPKSHCELNLGEEQIDQDGLWNPTEWMFRPWYWPYLPLFLEKIESRIERLEDSLDKTIIDFFSFQDEIKKIPLSSLSYLGQDPKKATFRNFVTNSGNGLKYNDESPEDDIVKQIAAVKIGKWFEKIILPGQNILIDSPHLVYRYPSLLSDKVEEIETWNKTVQQIDYREIGIDHDRIEENKFKHEDWISKTVWFWQDLMKNEEIQEVKEPWTRKKIDFRFCEDSSSFKHFEDCLEYKIEHYSPYKIRYINKEKISGVEYKPAIMIM